VIVVAGSLEPLAAASVSVSAIGARVAASGGAVEAVGVVPADEIGDRRLLELATLGVGHAAVLRSSAQRLDGADLDLALRYLPEVRAVVLVEPERELLEPAIAAAAWSGAALIVITSAGASELDDLGDAVVLAPPPVDPDGTFAGFVAALAGRLAAGEDAATAFGATVDDLAVDRVNEGRWG
jgi:hypothetical protein